MDNNFIELLLELHKNLPQEAPGSEESTLKAFSFIKDLPEKPNILDIGCGPGRQSINLAKKTDGKIIGVDIFVQYLEQLKATSKKLKLENKVSVRNCSMDDLPFDKQCFDLIWSEGSAYIIGFEKALKYWRTFLKPMGYLAVTEIAWLKDNQPEELNQFWLNGYPDIKTINENISLIKSSSYEIINHFTLPKNDWFNYYEPLKKRIELIKKSASPKMLKHIEYEEIEIKMFEKYSEYYSYEFFILKKAL